MPRYFPGRQVICYAKKETTYGTAVTCGSEDAFLTLSETFTPTEERDVRPDRSGHASHLERWVGRKSATFEITKLILPSGSVTTEPDDTLLWEAGFGRASVGASSVEYLPATAHAIPLTLRRGVRNNTSDTEAEYQEHIRGAIVNRIEIGWGNQGNNNLAQVTFSGLGKEWGYTGNGTINPTAQLLGTVTGVTTDNSKHFSAGSQVIIGPANKHGKGRGLLINSLNITTKRLLISSTTGVTHMDGDTIRAYNPTAVTAGAPIHGRQGLLSLDGSATNIQHVGGRITYEDNRALVNEEVGSDSPTDVIRTGKRNVTFTMEFLAKSSDTPQLLDAMRRNVSQNLQVNIGNAANKTLKILMAQAEFDLVPTTLPDADMMRWNMSGRALGSRANNEIKVRIL